MTTDAPIVGIGEILWDLLPTGPRLGGAPANFAFHCQQLGHPAVAVSRVGTHANGNEIRQTLHRLGLSDEFLQADPDKPTGSVVVTLDNRGHPHYTIAPDVAWDRLDFTRALWELARRCRAVCFGTLAQREARTRTTLYRFLKEARRRPGGSALIVCDINFRQHYFDREKVETSLWYADWLKLNEHELSDLIGLLGLTRGSPSASLAELRGRYGLDLVCLTRGERGCLVQAGSTWQDVQEIEQPGIPVTAIDTVGAGDAFTAGLVVASLEGKPLSEAVLLANKLAAKVAGSAGATPSLTRADLDA